LAIKNYSVYGVQSNLYAKPLLLKDVHNYRYEILKDATKSVEWDIDGLQKTIEEDINQNGLTPIMVIYSIRDPEVSLKEIPLVEELCKKYDICLYINGDEMGMFGCMNELWKKVAYANYLSIGFAKIAGMTSTFIYVDNRDEFKNNLVSITHEYYKSSAVERKLSDTILTQNKMIVKDYVIGFGHQTSLMKLLFYFESRGKEGFMNYLKRLNENADSLEKELRDTKKYENFVRFENMILADRIGEESNEEFHKKVHQKFDENLSELFGLYELGGKKRCLFVASSGNDNFS